MQQFRAWSSARRRSCCWAERRNGICRRDVSTERDEPHVRHGCGPARNNLQSDDARLVPHSHSHSRCLESIDTYIHGRGRTPEARCEIELRPHTGRAPERSKEKKRKKKKEKKKKKKKKRKKKRNEHICAASIPATARTRPQPRRAAGIECGGAACMETRWKPRKPRKCSSRPARGAVVETQPIRPGGGGGGVHARRPAAETAARERVRAACSGACAMLDAFPHARKQQQQQQQQQRDPSEALLHRQTIVHDDGPLAPQRIYLDQILYLHTHSHLAFAACSQTGKQNQK